MERKSDKVRRLVAAGDYKEALRIAKGFKLGISEEDSDDMVRGFESMAFPRFYHSIGMDPSALIQKGIETLKRLYG